ncbi:MAG TPA: hypothetical protein VHG91_18135 [Longimicrobium sp.]|nr:hypothetical protein [Longimicrobium sp.]
MRKVLVVCAALLLGAVPAIAQQATPDGGAAAVEQVVPAQPAQAEADAQKAPAPSLAVSTDEVRRNVAAAEEKRSDRAQVGSQSFWYLVAAIAIGIIIAAVVLD